MSPNGIDSYPESIKNSRISFPHILKGRQIINISKFNFDYVTNVPSGANEQYRSVLVIPRILCYVDDAKAEPQIFDSFKITVKSSILPSGSIIFNKIPSDFLMEVKYGFLGARLPYTYSQRFFHSEFIINIDSHIEGVNFSFETTAANNLCFVSEFYASVHRVNPFCREFDETNYTCNKCIDGSIIPGTNSICSKCSNFSFVRLNNDENPDMDQFYCEFPINLSYFPSPLNNCNLNNIESAYVGSGDKTLKNFQTGDKNKISFPPINSCMSCENSFSLAYGFPSSYDKLQICTCPFEICGNDILNIGAYYQLQEFRNPMITDLGNIGLTLQTDSFFNIKYINIDLPYIFQNILFIPPFYPNETWFWNYFVCRLRIINRTIPNNSENFVFSKTLDLENYTKNMRNPLNNNWSYFTNGIDLHTDNLKYYDCFNQNNDSWTCNLQVTLLHRFSGMIFIDGISKIEINTGNLIKTSFGIQSNPTTYNNIPCIQNKLCSINTKFNSNNMICNDSNCINSRSSNFNVGDTMCVKTDFYLVDQTTTDSISNYQVGPEFIQMLLYDSNGNQLSFIDLTGKITKPNPSKNIFCFPILISDKIYIDTTRVTVSNSISVNMAFKFTAIPRRNLNERQLDQPYEIGTPANIIVRVEDKSISDFFETVKINSLGDNAGKVNNTVIIIIACALGSIILILVLIIFLKKKQKQLIKIPKDDIQSEAGEVKVQVIDDVASKSDKKDSKKQEDYQNISRIDEDMKKNEEYNKIKKTVEHKKIKKKKLAQL